MIKRSSSGSTDSFEPTSFSPEECHTIQARLESKIPPDGIAYRSSGGGQVAYLEGWRAFNYANEIFGFNGWSSEILNFTTDFMENDGGKISVGVACTVRIILKDGTFHDDIGYGTAENQRIKGAALDKARKEAVTDAIKRALRIFGNHLGNCCYDKDYLKSVKNGSRTAAPPPPSTTYPHQRLQQAAGGMNRPDSTFAVGKPPQQPAVNHYRSAPPPQDDIMTEEEVYMGHDMVDIPRHQEPAAPVRQGPSLGGPPNSIPRSPARATGHQSPPMHQWQPPQAPQPDFRPFQPHQSSAAAPPQQPQAPPAGDFVKWNPAGFQAK